MAERWRKQERVSTCDFTSVPVGADSGMRGATYARSLSYPTRWLPVTDWVFVLNSLSCKAAHLRLPPFDLRCAHHYDRVRRARASHCLVQDARGSRLANRFAWADRTVVTQVTAGHSDGSTARGACFWRDDRFVRPCLEVARDRGNRACLLDSMTFQLDRSVTWYDTFLTGQL